jgi:IS30 family transposase
MTYTHLTQDERYQIAILNKAGHDQSDIGRVMKRNKSTVSREMTRNCGARGYRPKQAQEISRLRMRERQNGPRVCAQTWAFADARLGELWSPEQICGHLKASAEPGVSHESIYQRIYTDKRAGGTLHLALRCQKARRKRYGVRERRGTIPNQVSIEQRPAIVESRKRFGDWEGDLVIGAGQQQALVTLNEREVPLLPDRPRAVQDRTGRLGSHDRSAQAFCGLRPNPDDRQWQGVRPARKNCQQT